MAQHFTGLEKRHLYGIAQGRLPNLPVFPRKPPDLLNRRFTDSAGAS
jgi:hypothetical protein